MFERFVLLATFLATGAAARAELLDPELAVPNQKKIGAVGLLCIHAHYPVLFAGFGHSSLAYYPYAEARRTLEDRPRLFDTQTFGFWPPEGEGDELDDEVLKKSLKRNEHDDRLSSSITVLRHGGDGHNESPDDPGYDKSDQIGARSCQEIDQTQKDKFDAQIRDWNQREYREIRQNCSTFASHVFEKTIGKNIKDKRMGICSPTAVVDGIKKLNQEQLSPEEAAYRSAGRKIEFDTALGHQSGAGGGKGSGKKSGKRIPDEP